MDKYFVKHIDKENYFSFLGIKKLTKKYDCSGNQILVLMAIVDVIMYRKTRAITLDYLKDVTGLNKAAIARNVQSLVEKGLIEK